MTLAAIVLATGAPSAVGVPRQLALVDDGRPLVRVVVEAATRSVSDAVVVVIGPHAERIERAIAGLDVVQLRNARWIEGAASSIRAGVAWADAQGFDSIVLASADRNRTTTEHLDALVKLHRRGNPIVASRHYGALGLPAVFGRECFRDLMGLLGDRGARDVIASSESVAAIDLAGEDAEAPARSGTRATFKRPRPRIGRG